MQTRFLHSSDWQLGVTRKFLSADSQARWGEARFEAIRTLGRTAQEQGCEFVVVAGDIFETNQVDRRTVLKACDAMEQIPVPVFLLPANHDPLDAGSVFLGRAWRERKPAHVRVLEDPASPIEVRPGIEVVGAPWTSKRPLCDLVARTAENLSPAEGRLRIMVGHGAVDTLSPDPANPALIRVADAERAIREGRYHYLALGDRHSYTAVGTSGRIYYSGTHEAYDFDEVDPGKVQVVDLREDGINVTSVPNGRWRFLTHEAQVGSIEDVEALQRYLDGLTDKASTVLKLGLVGALGLAAHARLEEVEDAAQELFAAVIRSRSRTELVLVPDVQDFDSLNLAGFGATAVAALRSRVERGGEDAPVAADALALLFRLAGRSV